MFVKKGDFGYLFEFKLAHDETQDKWLEEIKNDREKLKIFSKNSNPNIFAIQTIVFFTLSHDLSNDNAWKKWLNRMDFWNLPTCFEKELPLIPKGQMVLKAWKIDP